MIQRTTLLITASLGAVAVMALYLLVKKKKIFSKVSRVKKLYFYPIKSLKGVEVKELKCASMGVEAYGLLDRSFMLVSGENILISLRQEPSLILIDIEFSENHLVLSHSSLLKPLQIDIKNKVSPNDKILHCKVHVDFIKGVDCGNEAAEWFQAYLKRSDVRLVQCLPELGERKYPYQNPNFIKATKNHKVGFQDAAAVHIFSEASVEKLNSEIDGKITELNFRPNILVEGCSPFEEDDWQFLLFSSGVELANVYPCGRCVLTTVDPLTGVKTDKEPLKTLRKLRAPLDKDLAKDLGYSPCFGILCRVDRVGSVQVGDDVFAVVKKGQYKIGVKS